MKVIAVVDEENVLMPLEYGNTIVEIDTETGEKKLYENPGYGSPYPEIVQNADTGIPAVTVSSDVREIYEKIAEKVEEIVKQK